MRFIAAVFALLLAVAPMGCDASPTSQVRADEGLVRTCAMQLAKNRYEHQVGDLDDDSVQLPPFWVALYGAGVVASGLSVGDRLSYMSMFAGPQYEPRWRSTTMLTDEAQQRVAAQRARIVRAGGRRYLQLMRDAIPLCERDPLIVPPPSAERPSAA